MADAFTPDSTEMIFPSVCVHTLVEEQVRRTPDAVAIEFGGEAITYDELNRRANQLARRLAALGVAKNVLVGLCTDRSIEMLVGLLGILKAGGAYVPLDPAYPADRLSFMMTDSGMRVLVTHGALADALVIPSGVEALSLGDPDLEQLEASDVPADAASATPENLAYVIYTSGSSGQPKGVLVPHRAVVNLLVSVRQRPGLSADDVVLAITTPSFDIAVSELLLPLTVGARIVLASREVAADGVRLLRLIRDAGVTFVDATPSTWRLLLDAGWDGGERLTAICTGEAMPRDLARELVARAGTIWNGYGPTETTVWSTFYELSGFVERVLIGTPIANTRIYILDERMQPVAAGAPGELYIAGAGVTCGYLNRPELTRERFLPDPFGPSGSTMYRTGDLGRYVDDRQIECLGRNDDQVKLRGFRIELGEIEEALGQHEAVARAAVIAREDRPGDRRLVGYLVLRKGRTVADAALRAHISRFLPEYMIPAAFVRLDALPLTPSGKVNRRDLPAPAPVRSEPETLVPPRTPTEAMLVDLWRHAFGLDRVSVDDNFFALGGHSLLASNVLARLRRDHGIEILFRTIFEAPTIGQLAARIDAHPRNADRSDRAIPRTENKGASALSVAQERMWLLEMMDPHQRVVHNLPAAWKLTGELDEGILETSLNAIVARHEALRTRIIVRDGQALQEVVPRAPLTLGRLDLRDRPEGEREAEMLAFCDRESRTPHDLAVAPLLRASLIHLDERQHVLFIVPHNLIWDGWSFDIFLRELSELYAALLGGRPSALEDLAISYRDFAGWQRQWLAGDRSTGQRLWWRTYLEGPLPVLDVPSDRPRPVEPTLAATQIDARLSREQASALTAISANAGGTLFTILFAAFCLLIHRLSGSDEVLVGTPVHGRTRPETEELIGLFTNMLVLRSRIEQEETFSSFLGRVREMTLDAFGHQELPLEALDVRAPILRAFFTMEDGRQQTQKIGGLTVQPLSTPPAALAADLRLSATETTDGVSVAWTCSSELFDAVTAQRCLKRFQALIDDVVRDPRRRIDEINLIPEDERAALHAFGNVGSLSAPVEKRVVALFEEQARRRPQAAAIVCGPDIVEYGQLDRRATAVARALRAGGVRDGSRVGIFLSRSADLVTSLLAVMKAGAVWVPVDPDDPPGRHAAILQDSGAELILTTETLRRRLPPWSAPVVFVNELAEAEIDPAHPTTPTGPAGTGIDAAACLLYSSDTDPLRRAAVSHRALAALVGAVVGRLAFSEDEVASAILPPSLDASVVELLAPLTTGARLLVAEEDVALDTARFAEIAGRATFVIAPTALWEDLLLPSTTVWTRLKPICIGEPPSPEIAAALATRTAGAWAAHGFTEAGIWTTLTRLTDSQPATVLGRPLSHVRVRIVNPTSDDVPLGVTGEVWISPTGETAGAWSRTGERARWRNSGELELVAARDRHVHVGGFRTDLDDVSRVLLRVLAVEDAAVVRQAQATERLIAYIVPGQRLKGTATEWRREMRRVLPERAIPRSFIEIDAIPRTAEGRLALAAAEADTAQDDYVPPGTATEILLADVWKDALGLPRIGLHDNFFDLGGYSLLCFQVLARIERETRHRVSPRLLLLDSLQQVAAQLDATDTPGDRPPGERSGQKRFLDRFRGAPSGR